MYLTKKRVYISILTILVVTIGIVVFIQPMQLNKATEKMVHSLEEQVDDYFEVKWSDIQQQSIDTFNATVQSKKTGYIYDVTVQDGLPNIQYEVVNKLMNVNENIELQLKNVFSMTQQDVTVLLTPRPLTKEEILLVRTSFQTNRVSIYTLDQNSYTMATKHIDTYFQRSTMPLQELEKYNPKIEHMNINN